MKRQSENRSLSTTTTAPGDDLLRIAVERGTDPDSLAKLVDLQERIMRLNAERAFNAAIQAFQAECPPVQHDGKAAFGNTRYTYATLARVAETIRPLMDKHGLSYGFTSSQAQDGVTVTCTVSHVEGHSKSSDFTVSIDNSAKGMNIMQKAASALSYARRYALLMALGITTAEFDDDGHTATSPQRPRNTAKVVSKDDLYALYDGYERHRGFNSEDKDGRVAEVGRLLETKLGIHKDKWTDPSHWDVQTLQTAWDVIEGRESL